MDKMTFKELGLQVLDIREQEGIRAIDSERARFKKHLIESSLSNQDISKIRPKDIATFSRSLCQKMADDNRGSRRISPLTAGNVMQLARAVFDEAVAQGYRDDNPCLVIRKPRRTESTEDVWTYLTAEEIQSIETCDAIPEAARCLILFAIGTGLRQGEQWNLEMRDLHVDGPEPHVFVRFGSRGEAPKNGKRRTVPLFGLALKVAKRWLELRPATLPGNPDLVFPTVTGLRRQIGAPDDFAKWLRFADISRPVRWHDFRHTAATCLVTGVWGHVWSLVDVRDFLGHSSIVMTERYSHLGQTGVKRAAALTGAGT